jgi:cold shock CspA family protein
MSNKLKNNKGQLLKWFESSGYGFIRFQDRHVFVHRTSYLHGFIPEVGQIVEFDFGLCGNKPPQAVNVRVFRSAKAVAAEREIQRGLEALLSGKIETVADTSVLRFTKSESGHGGTA